MKTREELSKEIHDLVKTVFRGRITTGYCWLKAKFKSTNMNLLPEKIMQEMILCLTAKNTGNICEVHGRSHDKITLKEKHG